VKSNQNIEKIENILSNCRKALLVGHFNPDGDSVGSVVAFHHYLNARNIFSSIVLPSKFPDYLEFLDPVESKIMVYTEHRSEVSEALAQADVIVCLDFNNLKRTEQLEPLIRESSIPKIMIDHHPFPETGPFDVVISETEISSACELLFKILCQMPDVKGDVNNLSIECARALYAGMMTDTNNFYNSVYPSTFEMASALIGRGVDKNLIQEYVFHCYSEERMKLMGHLLKDSLFLLKGSNVAYIMLSDKDKKGYNFSSGDSEGFVNLPLSIRGIKMSALFTENISPEETNIRVSFRSKGNWDVNRFSNLYFNGGGHINASGGRLYIPFDEVPQYFEKALKEYLDEK